MATTTDDSTDAGDVDDALPALENACQEGRKTLDQQVEWMRQIDRKAIRILRVNVLLLGLTLTALSILVRTEVFDAGPYVNLHTALGIASLLGSTTFATITYVSSRFESGIKWTKIEETVNGKYDELGWYRRLALGYSDWIEYNALVIKLDAILSTITILLVMDAVALLTAGILVGGFEVDGTPISYLVLVLLSGILVAVNYLVFRIDDLLELYHRNSA